MIFPFIPVLACINLNSCSEITARNIEDIKFSLFLHLVEKLKVTFCINLLSILKSDSLLFPRFLLNL